MESGQSLKRRMKSVQNIGQITKAMELVSATKMRKSQELALTSRPYAYAALELLGILSSLKDMPTPALFEKRTVEHTAFLLMMSDRGLAGSFNGAVVREFEKYMKANTINITDPRYSFIAVGQKAKSYLERRKANVIASFTRIGDASSILDAEPIAEFLIDGYVRHDFDSVVAFFTTFVTALRQDPVKMLQRRAQQPFSGAGIAKKHRHRAVAHPGRDHFECGGVELFLALEVVIEQRLVDASRGGNRLGARPGQSARGKLGQCGIENAAARFGGTVGLGFSLVWRRHFELTNWLVN